MKLANLFAALLAAAAIAWPAAAVHADGNERGEYGRERGEDHDNGRGGRYLAPENAAYRQECSSCHFLFPPGLLPAASWDKLLRSNDKHFGENLALDEAAVSEIAAFLKANSAEKTPTEWGRKILRSAGKSVPLRITEVPWIVREHRKIKDEVYKRASIGSRSNCGACHPNGSKGDFEEESVRIPKD